MQLVKGEKSIRYDVNALKSEITETHGWQNTVFAYIYGT